MVMSVWVIYAGRGQLRAAAVTVVASAAAAAVAEGSSGLSYLY